MELASSSSSLSVAPSPVTPKVTTAVPSKNVPGRVASHMVTLNQEVDDNVDGT